MSFKIFDRALQAQLLIKLAEAYPEMVSVDSKPVVGDPMTFNLCYLEDSGLVVNTRCKQQDGPVVVTKSAITHAGLDLVFDDGGPRSLVFRVREHFISERDCDV
ncbi:MAG: hypothetical protein ACXV79_05700 [Methylobacter sp.]